MVRIALRHLRPTPSMAVALTALVVALGGTSYAVTQLAANSVTSKAIKNQAVTRGKIKNNAINAAKVANGSLLGADVGADALTGREIKESTLGQVPSAQSAATATSATSAASAAGLDKVVYRVAQGTVPAATTDPAPGGGVVTAHAGATATCDPGQRVTGGGVKVDDIDNTAVVDSYPENSGSWSARVDNSDTSSTHSFIVYAVCVTAAATG
jgi:hypothetical protein